MWSCGQVTVEVVVVVVVVEVAVLVVLVAVVVVVVAVMVDQFATNAVVFVMPVSMYPYPRHHKAIPLRDSLSQTSLGSRMAR